MSTVVGWGRSTQAESNGQLEVRSILFSSFQLFALLIFFQRLGVVTSTLQRSRFPISSWPDCLRVYHRLRWCQDNPVINLRNPTSFFYRDLDETTQLCAGTQGNDACSGDSGGALTVKRESVLNASNVHYQGLEQNLSSSFRFADHSYNFYWISYQ
jgi:hypothetical protein